MRLQTLLAASALAPEIKCAAPGGQAQVGETMLQEWLQNAGRGGQAIVEACRKG